MPSVDYKQSTVPAIRVCEAALCCDTGFCGADIDTSLVEVSANVRLLQSLRADITRHNLAGDPTAFTVDETVRAFTHTIGSKGLPHHREIARQVGDSMSFVTPLMRLQDPDLTKVVLVARGEPLALTTQCMSIFVAPDAGGRTAPVPALLLETAEDLRLDAHARQLTEMRAALTAMPISDGDVGTSVG